MFIRPSFLFCTVFALITNGAVLAEEVSPSEFEIDPEGFHEIEVAVPETSGDGYCMLEFQAIHLSDGPAGYTKSLVVRANGRELTEIASHPPTFPILDGRDIPSRGTTGWTVAYARNVETLEGSTYQSRLEGFNPLQFQFPLRGITPGKITLRFENREKTHPLSVRNTTLRVVEAKASPSGNEHLLDPGGSTEIKLSRSGNDTERTVPIGLWIPSPYLSGSRCSARVFFQGEEVVDAVNREGGWREDATRTSDAYQSGAGWRVLFAPDPEAYEHSYASGYYVAPEVFDKVHLLVRIPNEDGVLRVENTSPTDNLGVRFEPVSQPAP